MNRDQPLIPAPLDGPTILGSGEPGDSPITEADRVLIRALARQMVRRWIAEHQKEPA